MEKPCLKNPDEFPDDEVLSKTLGTAQDIWINFLNFLKDNHPQFEGRWRYYNDGKNWLYKIIKKKKTICWVSVYPGKFKTTFYFPDRAEDLICSSDLDPEYVDKFVNGKRYGKTRGLSIDIQTLTDLENTKKLIEIKEKIK